jgi:hypothetical protein
MTRKRTTTRMRAYGWNERYRGRKGRGVAAAGGDIINGFISGVAALWTLPKNRKGRRRTVRRRA